VTVPSVVGFQVRLRVSPASVFRLSVGMLKGLEPLEVSWLWANASRGEAAMAKRADVEKRMLTKCVVGVRSRKVDGIDVRWIEK
jgi:hypothetical protein